MPKSRSDVLLGGSAFSPLPKDMLCADWFLWAISIISEISWCLESFFSDDLQGNQFSI